MTYLRLLASDFFGAFSELQKHLNAIFGHFTSYFKMLFSSFESRACKNEKILGRFCTVFFGDFSGCDGI